jgi:heme exporter protein A
MLFANNISFKRDNNQILENINFTISPKKIFHLVGNNGVGKTTLLKIIANILEPDEGEVFWDGKNIKKNSFNFFNNLTFIMDNQMSNNNLTLIENIMFWHKLFSSKIKNSEIDSILELLSLEKYRNIIISKLSYGEIKKIELIRLIIEQKKLWLLDEPYIGLDKKSSELISQTITNHVEFGGMVIFTSHIVPAIQTLHTIKI